MKIVDEIKKLNSNLSDFANQKKAKKLRKTLITSGVMGIIFGVIGVLTCFILFATAGFSAFGDSGFTARIIVPFCLFPVFGVLTGVSGLVLRLGLSVLVAGVTTKFIDDNITKRCPNCGDIIDSDELFCEKCGAKIRKTCPSCGEVQDDPNAKFCKKCGKEL